VWVSPYYEEDLTALSGRIGVDRILFGSDWPHGEGLESPLSFTEELKGFSEADVQKVMRDNALDFLGVRAAVAA
jgi:predicted TIM-barrel fold metal-dependent hydrolase